MSELAAELVALPFVGVNRSGEVRINHGDNTVSLEAEGPAGQHAVVILAPETARALAAGLRCQSVYAEGGETPTRELPRKRSTR